MKSKLNGFSLVELIIAVLFVAVLAAVAIPRMNFSLATEKGAQATAKKIATDLRRTRQLAISDAVNNTSGYRLRMNGSSPFSSYDIINLDTAAIVDSHTIPSGISCTNGSDFRFGPLGNLLTGSDTQIDVDASDQSLTVSVTSATGMVKCVQN